MTVLTKEDVREVVYDLLEARSRIPQETHREHHDFLGVWIQKEQMKKERWEKVKTQVLGWGVIAIIGGIGTAVYHYLGGGK